MKVSEVYSSGYLKAADLSKPARVRIERVTLEEMNDAKGEPVKRFVLHFHNARKSFVVNKTSATTLAMNLGDDTDDWAGKEIVLSPGTAPNGQPTITVGAVVEQSAGANF